MNSDSIEDFLDSIFVRSHSVETVRTYRGGIKRFERFLSEKKDITLSSALEKMKDNEFDPYQLLRDFVVFQDKSGLKPRTIHLRVNAVKSFLRHYGIKIYTEDFKQSVKMPRKIASQEIPLTKEIIQRLLRNISPKLQTVVLVAVSSGMRISEIVQLRIGDIDFETEPTRIRLRAETTKTRTARDVFITKEATLALKDYLRRYHKWDGTNESIRYDKMIFGRTSMSRLPVKKEEDLSLAPLIAAKSLLQKSLENAIKKLPDLNMKSVDGKRMIHFHAFRKFFRTTVGNISGRDKEFLDLHNTWTAEQIAARPDKVLCAIGFYSFTALIDMKIKPGARYIHSSSEPYNEEQELSQDRQDAWIQHFGMNKFQSHCSGHARGRDILEAVKEIDAKSLYPVHTEHPEIYQKVSSNCINVKEGFQHIIE